MTRTYKLQNNKIKYANGRGTLLVNNKLCSQEKFSLAVVYRINCSMCISFYIGQTGRSFNIRYKEHIRSWRLKKTDSTFANHLLENSHSCDINNLKIFHTVDKSFKLSWLEAFEIRLAVSKGESVLNDQLDVFNSNILRDLVKAYS